VLVHGGRLVVCCCLGFGPASAVEAVLRVSGWVSGGGRMLSVVAG
jgi:hypothetical protein